MPAYNAGAPRSTAIDPTSDPVANPGATGAAVLMDPFSGPTGSPGDKDSSNNASTGALSTGIGFGLTFSPVAGVYNPADPKSVNYPTDNVTPGVTMPDGTTAATDAILTTIGGGRSAITPGTGSDYSKGESNPDPWSAQPLMAFGGGVVREEGTGALGAPPMNGYGMKLVTAPGAVANGAVVETGFKNYSGLALTTGQSVYGTGTTVTAMPTSLSADMKKAGLTDNGDDDDDDDDDDDKKPVKPVPRTPVVPPKPQHRR